MQEKTYQFVHMVDAPNWASRNKKDLENEGNESKRSKQDLI